jgi:hypothetical protein
MQAVPIFFDENLAGRMKVSMMQRIKIQNTMLDYICTDKNSHDST